MIFIIKLKFDPYYIYILTKKNNNKNKEQPYSKKKTTLKTRSTHANYKSKPKVAVNVAVNVVCKCYLVESTLFFDVVCDVEVRKRTIACNVASNIAFLEIRVLWWNLQAQEAVFSGLKTNLNEIPL